MNEPPNTLKGIQDKAGAAWKNTIEPWLRKTAKTIATEARPRLIQAVAFTKREILPRLQLAGRFVWAKWKALSPKAQIITVAVVVLPFVVQSWFRPKNDEAGSPPSLTGGNPKEGAPTGPQGPAASPFAVPSTAPSAPILPSSTTLFFVDADDMHGLSANTSIDNLPRLEKGSLGRSFVVFGIFKGLNSGVDYKASCEVKDPNGSLIVCDPISMEGDSNFNWVYFTVTPNPSKNVHGNWICSVGLNGTPVQQATLVMQQPSARELQSLADHEEATAQARRAFAHYWVSVPHQKRTSFVTALHEPPSNKNVPSGAVISASQFDRIAHGNSKTAEASEAPPQKLHLFQVIDVNYETEQGIVSEADYLNGITYRGGALFTFGLYREFLPNSEEWTPWKDVQRPSGVLDEGLNFLTRQLRNQLAPLVGLGEQQAPCMKFTIEKRDGHWIIATQGGGKMIDGVEIPSDKLSLSERGSIRPGRAMQPSREVVKGISESGTTERARLLDLARKIEASPDVARQQEADTIQALK